MRGWLRVLTAATMLLTASACSPHVPITTGPSPLPTSSNPAPPPPAADAPFSGPLSLDPRAWSTTGEFHPTLRAENSSLVVPLPSSSNVQLNYLYAEANRRLRPGQTIELTLVIRTSGLTIFRVDDPVGIGLPPSCRLFFSAFQHLGGADDFARWWSNPDAIVLAPGTFALSVPLDPARWSQVGGKFGSAYPEAFAAALASSTALGITFGGGYSFGHGVYVLGGGAAEVVVTRYMVF